MPDPAHIDTAPRPLLARLLAPAAIPVQREGTATRWSLYSGALVQTAIYGVNKGQLINLIIDLGTLEAPAKIPALASHIAVPTAVLGDWTKMSKGADGLTADFTPMQIPAEAADLFNSARAIAALLAAKIPLQASVGVEPGPGGEYVRLSAVTTINGQTIDPTKLADPVYVLRKGQLKEASVVLFGADSQTGPHLASLAHLAAPLIPTPSPESSMERLKALLTKHPDHAALVAQRVAAGDDDLAVSAAVHTAQLAAVTGEVATLKTSLTTITTERDALKTENAKLKADLAKKPGEKQVPAAGEGDDTAPTTLAAALAKHSAELKGKPMEHRVAFLRQAYPDLKA